jgi:spermidine synthase
MKNRVERIAKWWPLFLISFLGLFFELAVIRWVSGEVRLFAYFKNLPLLAAFLGLALGFGLVGKGRDYRSSFAPLLLLFSLVVLGVGFFSSDYLAYPARGDDFLWYTAPVTYWISLLLFLGLVLIFFLLIVLLFIPLGQATGEEMAEHDPVPAYVVNILASLMGVWAFSLVSYLETPPILWLAISMIGTGVYFIYRRAFSKIGFLLFALTFGVVALLSKQATWSPYQRLDISPAYLEANDDREPIEIGYLLNVQQVFYQQAIDLSDDFLASLQGTAPDLDDMAFSYNLPYLLLPEDSRVLIVGAGMGNDVAAALRGNVARVDAVEIDPTILAFGRQFHPEQPYDDPRVTAIVDDARSYFTDCQEAYDAIIFGLLDSHTLLSGMSNVRLDSFIYTLESFEQVREHISDDGFVMVTFSVGAPWIEERIGRILTTVFSSEQVFVHRGFVGTSFVVGDFSPDSLDHAQLAPWQSDPSQSNVPLTTDDWPYLYMRTKIIPPAYWQALLLIALLFLALATRKFPEAIRPDWHFWLLGAAFLLIEFKSITELALLFGTTWLVNALAISGVLIMVLAANVLVLRRARLNLRWAYVLLLASLLGLYFFPLEILAGISLPIRIVASVLLLSMPLFFSGLIFSESLRITGETSKPLASNLSGTMVGGMLEYGSLIWGIKSLYLIAMVVYLAAFIIFTRGKTPQPAT